MPSGMIKIKSRSFATEFTVRQDLNNLERFSVVISLENSAAAMQHGLP